MLKNTQLDCVHVLTPPNLHYSLAKAALQAGLHVFLEKPMCTSVAEADNLLELANRCGVRLGVNHNFLFSSAYRQMREAVDAGGLGPLDHVSLNYFFELPQLRTGPYNSWMLRAPGNVILEVGPHLISALLDFAGTPDTIAVSADRKIRLPGGAEVFRRWRIHSNVGRMAADININLGPGFDQRTIVVHGLLGSATVDFDANTCLIDRRTPLSSDLDHYKRSRSLAKQLTSQARKTLADYILSKLKLRQRGNPYQISMLDSVAAFYSALHTDTAVDRRLDGNFGRNVIEWCTKIVQAAQIVPAEAPISSGRKIEASPTVLVLGGAGFIGRALIRRLLAAGYCVRAMVRSSSAVLNDIDSDRLEIVRGDIRSAANLKAAMQGIEFVYHLATSEAKTWDESLRSTVEPARSVGEACLAAAVKRLIYTGTIDSYYAGANAGTVTEETPLDRKINRRNYYARAKAAAEGVLMDMHRTQALPVVIFRPEIVIGEGGNPFHWGVGKFSDSVCEVWGDGVTTLPFVLVDDVATALVRGIEVPGIEGRSYNLIDVPLLTARDYLRELQQRAGIALTVLHRPIWRYYLADLAKWAVKFAVGHPDRARIPSYRDWESRTQKAFYNSARARVELGWTPSSDRQRLVEEGIGGSLRSWLEAIN